MGSLLNPQPLPTEQLERRRVYDPLHRLLHWAIALAVVGLVATAWSAEIVEELAGSERAVWRVHVWIGYGLIAALGLRVLWGLVGPRHARLADMWHPRAWAEALRTRQPPTTRRYGHDVMASIAYLVLYGVLAAMALSGLGLAAVELRMGPLAGRFRGEFWKEVFEAPHEAGYVIVLGFLVVHLGAMIWHQRRDGVPIFAAMVHGDQFRPLLLAMGVTLAAAATARAEAPQGFLERYAAAAAAADPDFAGFDAARGRAFFAAEHQNRQGRTQSCTSCHTADPRQPGRTRANKAIEPLAPVANPDRFRDPAEVEKWFRRNCDDVLDRACTPREKGDLLTYLLSLGPS